MSFFFVSTNLFDLSRFICSLNGLLFLPQKSPKLTMAPSFCLVMAVLYYLRTRRPSLPHGHHTGQGLLAGFSLPHPISPAMVQQQHATARRLILASITISPSEDIPYVPPVRIRSAWNEGNAATRGGDKVSFFCVETNLLVLPPFTCKLNGSLPFLLPSR